MSPTASVLAWVLVGAGVLTSLLTLYAVARVWTKAFWRPRGDAPEGELADAAPSALIDESATSCSPSGRTWAGCHG